MKKIVLFAILSFIFCGCKTGDFNKETTKILEDIEFIHTVARMNSEIIANEWNNGYSMENTENKVKEYYAQLETIGDKIQNMKKNVSFPNGAYEDLISIYTDTKEWVRYIYVHGGSSSIAYENYVNRTRLELHKRIENYRLKYLTKN